MTLVQSKFSRVPACALHMKESYVSRARRYAVMANWKHLFSHETSFCMMHDVPVVATLVTSVTKMHAVEQVFMDVTAVTCK
jgi:hypothetical protein